MVKNSQMSWYMHGAKACQIVWDTLYYMRAGAGYYIVVAGTTKQEELHLD
jgi:hypothetical protein